MKMEIGTAVQCGGCSDVFWFSLQELQTRLSDEIGKLRSFISSRGSGDRSPHNNERSSCELEVRGSPRAAPLPPSPPCAGGRLLAAVLAWGAWEGGAGWSSGAGAGRRYASFPSAALPGRSRRFLPPGPSFLFHHRACAGARRPFQGGGSCVSSGSSPPSLAQVLLRVKENELQYLKKEVQCLREEMQMMQKVGVFWELLGKQQERGWRGVPGLHVGWVGWDAQAKPSCHLCSSSMPTPERTVTTCWHRLTLYKGNLMEALLLVSPGVCTKKRGQARSSSFPGGKPR